MGTLSRRAFLHTSGALATAAVVGCRVGGRRDGPTTAPAETWVNDVHSQLNRTRVAGVERPRDLDALRRLVGDVRRRRVPLSVCGGRHAGGGQAFLADRTLVDTGDLSRVLAFDDERGTVDVEAGIRWPALLDHLHMSGVRWTIRQKQGGADELSLGGAIGSNIHSRHLRSAPFVGDVESLTLVTPGGDVVTCDRTRDAELFRHAVGGYGLFGVVYSLRLRLGPRRKLVRRVEWLAADRAVSTLEAKRDAGAWHGDFQFSIDPASDEFCRAGLCSWYAPTDDAAPVRGRTAADAERTFRGLVGLAHADKTRAMAAYRKALEAESGVAVDWSDDWQRGNYVPDYHRAIDPARGGANGSEILSEFHVPRPALPDFLAAAAGVLREEAAELIYGVVRLIERDDETALAWAREPWACVIFNLHTQPDAASVARNVATLQRLLDAALARGGSYYLTYLRFARREQIERAHPALRDVLRAARRMDARGTLDSDWARHHRALLDV